MAWKPYELVDQFDQLPTGRRFGIDVDFPAALGQVGFFAKMLDPLGQLIDPIERKAERTADVAHGRNKKAVEPLRRGWRKRAPRSSVRLLDAIEKELKRIRRRR